MKDRLVKNLKTKKLSVSIGQVLIEYQSNQAESFAVKPEHFQLIEKQIRLIETQKNIIF